MRKAYGYKKIIRHCRDWVTNWGFYTVIGLNLKTGELTTHDFYDLGYNWTVIHWDNPYIVTITSISYLSIVNGVTYKGIQATVENYARLGLLDNRPGLIYKPWA